MSSSFSSPLALVCVLILLHGASAQLSPFYYSNSCPLAQSIVKGVITMAAAADPRLPASLTRLHFHDCFPTGCDGSILLDSTPTMQSEKFAPPNNQSARGYEVVDGIKSSLEAACPGVVSCADILAMSAQISVTMSGGPSWSPMLGRKDGTTASFTAASNLPSPFDSLPVLQQKFAAVGLDTTDLVTLSGAHTFGKAQCQFITNRLYNYSGTDQPDPTLNPAYGALLSLNCPQVGGNPAALNSLDPVTPVLFDSQYYQNIMAGAGLLPSDQLLLSAGGATAALVAQFAADQPTFFGNFVASMVKMGNIGPLTGGAGEVRQNCRKAN